MKCLSVPFQLYQNTVGVYVVMSDKYREKEREKQVIIQYAALLEKHKEFFSEGQRAQEYWDLIVNDEIQDKI